MNKDKFNKWFKRSGISPEMKDACYKAAIYGQDATMREIQKSVNAIAVPKLSALQTEYWKAGCRRAIACIRIKG